MIRLLTLGRVFGRSVGPRLSLGLLPVWGIAVFLCTQLQDAFDWAGIASWMQHQQPLDAGSTAAVAIALGALIHARAMGNGLYHDELAGLWRQPVLPVEWGAVLLPWTLLAGLPVIVLSMFNADPLALLAWTAGWLVAAVGAARGGAVGSLVAVAGAGVGGLSMALVRLTPWAAPVPLLALAAVPWVGGTLYLEGRHPSDGWVIRLPGRPVDALEAVVRRDLLCLLRTAPGVVWASLLPVVPVYVLMTALLEQDIIGGSSAFGTAVLCLALCSPLVGYAYSTLVQRLGGQLDPGSWPLDGFNRALALQLVGEVLMAPVGVTLVALLWGEGRFFVFRLVIAASCLTAGAVWATARTRLFREAGAASSWSLLVTCVVGVVAVTGPVTGLLGTAGLLLLALYEAGDTFEHARGQVA